MLNPTPFGKEINVFTIRHKGTNDMKVAINILLNGNNQQLVTLKSVIFFGLTATSLETTQCLFNDLSRALLDRCDVFMDTPFPDSKSQQCSV